MAITSAAYSQLRLRCCAYVGTPTRTASEAGPADVLQYCAVPPSGRTATSALELDHVGIVGAATAVGDRDGHPARVLAADQHVHPGLVPGRRPARVDAQIGEPIAVRHPPVSPDDFAAMDEIDADGDVADAAACFPHLDAGVEPAPGRRGDRPKRRPAADMGKISRLSGSRSQRNRERTRRAWPGQPARRRVSAPGSPP